MAETAAPAATAGPVARSPLSHRVPLFTPDGRAGIAEWPFLSKVILRADPEAASAAVEAAVGPALPGAPLASATAGDRSWLWLGPDEFLLVASDAAPGDLAASLETALAERSRQVVDVSDHYTVITVSGTHARDLLARLVTVDLHPAAFPAGRVVGTLAGHANVTLWLRDDSASTGAMVDVFVRASMADYLWCLLAEAGRTFGLPAETPRAGEPMRA